MSHTTSHSRDAPQEIKTVRRGAPHKETGTEPIRFLIRGKWRSMTDETARHANEVAHEKHLGSRAVIKELNLGCAAHTLRDAWRRLNLKPAYSASSRSILTEEQARHAHEVAWAEHLGADLTVKRLSLPCATATLRHAWSRRGLKPYYADKKKSSLTDEEARYANKVAHERHLSSAKTVELLALKCKPVTLRSRWKKLGLKSYYSGMHKRLLTDEVAINANKVAHDEHLGIVRTIRRLGLECSAPVLHHAWQRLDLKPYYKQWAPRLTDEEAFRAYELAQNECLYSGEVVAKLGLNCSAETLCKAWKRLDLDPIRGYSWRRTINEDAARHANDVCRDKHINAEQVIRVLGLHCKKKALYRAWRELELPMYTRPSTSAI